MKKTLSHYQDKKLFAGAFSFIELQVTLVILAIGLWSFAGLLKVYRQQSDYIAMNSEPNLYIENPEGWSKEYWVVSQSNKWMRQLEAPAGINQAAGQIPWTPPVDGNDMGEYSVTMTSTPVKNFDLQRAVVSINIEKNN